MMDPICRIKDHIVALNAVSYDDEPGLDAFLSEIQETIRIYFTDRSQYVTFLGAICFRPVSVFPTPAEAVLCWGRAKKQLREFLLVMLADAKGKYADQRAEGVSANFPESELEEAERIVSRHIGGGGDLSTLARVRIDLRDINILDDRVEKYLKRGTDPVLKKTMGPVLFFSGRDEGLNKVLAEHLARVDAQVVQIPSVYHSGLSIQEQFMVYPDAQMVIVALGEDCWLSVNGTGEIAEISSPAPGVCFGLGYLSGRLGRSRVVALYRDKSSFRRPTDFFELFYIPVDKSHNWRHELTLRFKQNRIGFKSIKPVLASSA